MSDFESLSVEVEPYWEIVDRLRYSPPEGICSSSPIRVLLISPNPKTWQSAVYLA